MTERRRSAPIAQFCTRRGPCCHASLGMQIGGYGCPGRARPATERVVRAERLFAVLSARRPIGADRGRRVDVSGLSFALFLDTPPVMAEGNWRVGVYLDDAASDRQAEQLGAVLSGQLGGPPAMLGPLISEMLGVEKAPITYSEDGRGHHVRIGDAADVGVEDFVAIEGHDPVQLTNVFHPSNTTLTVAPANAAHLSTFGIDWGREGQSGFSAPFSWSG